MNINKVSNSTISEEIIEILIDVTSYNSGIYMKEDDYRYVI